MPERVGKGLEMGHEVGGGLVETPIVPPVVRTVLNVFDMYRTGGPWPCRPARALRRGRKRSMPLGPSVQCACFPMRSSMSTKAWAAIVACEPRRRITLTVEAGNGSRNGRALRPWRANSVRASDAANTLR